MKGEELNTDTPPNVPFLIRVPFGNTHTMTGLIISLCPKVTSQVRLRVAPAMEEPKLEIVTQGGAGPTLTQNDDVRMTDYSSSPANM